MPFNPAVTDRSGEILANSIGRGISSITDAIEKHTAETKKLKAYRSMAVDGLGLDPEQVDKMDIGTLEGKMSSVAIRKMMGDMQRANEDQGFQREAAGRERANFDYQQSQRAAAERMMKDPAFTGVGPTGPTQPDFSPASIMGAASRAGVNMDPAEAMRVMEQGQNRRAAAGEPEVKTLNGVDLFFNKQTGQFQISPVSKEDAAGKKTQFQVEPMTDRITGKVTGYGVKATFADEDSAKSWAEQQNKAMGGSGKTGGAYKSADEVKAAVKAGTLKRDEALKILREQFGLK